MKTERAFFPHLQALQTVEAVDAGSPVQGQNWGPAVQQKLRNLLSSISSKTLFSSSSRTSLSSNSSRTPQLISSSGFRSSCACLVVLCRLRSRLPALLFLSRHALTHGGSLSGLFSSFLILRMLDLPKSCMSFIVESFKIALSLSTVISEHQARLQ
jgi:hypothetical protein